MSARDVADFLAVLVHTEVGFVARVADAAGVLQVLAATVAALRGDDVAAAWRVPDVVGVRGVPDPAARALRQVLRSIECPMPVRWWRRWRAAGWPSHAGRVERVQRVSYLGPAGTFTEAACRQLVDPAATEFVPAPTPPATLQLVRSGAVDAACVPVENSVEGTVPLTLDALATGTRLQIVAETELPISFSILVRPGTAAADVHTVRTHPHAAAQVRDWLAEHLPRAAIQAGSSTAAAALDVAGGTVDAAVATALVGERLGLQTLAAGVADVDDARTRFVLVRPPCPPPARTGNDRTSVVLSLDNSPGSLVQAMTEFAIRGIDLTRIESRPTRTALGTYRFYLDCVGHVEDPAVAEALAALHRRCTELRFLGSWAAATPEAGTAPPAPADAAQWVADIRAGVQQ